VRFQHLVVYAAPLTIIVLGVEIGFLQVQTVTVYVRLFMVEEARKGRGMMEMWERQEI